MSGVTEQRCFALEPLSGGGWRLIRYTVAGWKRLETHTDFAADHRTDPTGEAAYEQALREAEDWRRQSPAAERRTDVDLRNAIVRLRLAEFRAADHLPASDIQELTVAINSLVGVLRATGNLPGPRETDAADTARVLPMNPREAGR